MAFKITTHAIGFQAIADTSTTKQHPLGTIVHAVDDTYGAGEFIYATGVVNTVVGSWATISMDGGTTALLAANAKGPAGLAMSANVASQYGWYQISGKGVGKVLTGFLDNGDAYATATAGSVDDGVVAGDRVHNATGASAVGTPSAGLAEFELNRPFTDDIAD